MISKFRYNFLQSLKTNCKEGFTTTLNFRKFNVKLYLTHVQSDFFPIKDSVPFCYCVYVLRILEWFKERGFPEDGAYQYTGILTRFMTMRESRS